MDALTAAGPPESGPGPATIVRVAGPLVELTCSGGVAMHDLVRLGRAGLLGEVVAIGRDTATVQAYEYTGGLAPGHAALPRGRPLTALLGPHLLGGVFDGLLRPLSGAGDRLVPGLAPEPSQDDGLSFSPRMRAGDEAGEGAVLGEAGGPGPVPFRVLVPPGAGGTVTWIAPEGRCSTREPVARVGRTDVSLTTEWPVRTPRPVRERVPAREALHTGQRVIDLLFPVAKGGTVAVPGGFGTGKTVLLQQIAKWSDADVIVYVGCGERGNEMADLLTEFAGLEDPRTGGRLVDRTVTIANTSNMPMMARETSIHTGVTVAEYFRDMGLDVVVIADSTSRWAEALREFASRTGALPAEEGYPAELASAIAAFYERAGAVTTLGGTRGSVTVIGAVSPPGGDMTEPVTAHTERFVRCLWVLDRDLAYARHYPAVSWAGSFSRDADVLDAGRARPGDTAAPAPPPGRARVAALLAEADRLAGLVDLVGITALPARERISVLAGRLIREGLLQQSALSARDAFCTPEKTAALVDATLAVVDQCTRLVDAGVAVTAVEETDFTPLLRAREETGPGDAAGVADRRDAMLGRLRALR
ncbi:V-type ATP synthase subunit A [Streptomyces sp. ET3-23]|uniref:V-type ATP synthase subunit A n=1 Tax=Streptomyces sp. ET3-23 TaxID=2885643 RepID=UPI001D12DA17|nr:V-type ATP synthase subunit A [Streptomyces sp. ET3-23]MCC2274401.1 V-type ATP synthase subunit A [Streptomyces sp. ET3-23]